MREYEAVHRRLLKARGRAKEHLCVDCGTPASDWSLNHMTAATILTEKGRDYSSDLEDYSPRCRACHFTLDGNSTTNYKKARAVLAQLQADPEYRRENGKKISAALSTVTVDHIAPWTPERKARQSAIHKALRVRCLECGMVSHPGALGRHQKASGHESREDEPAEELL